MDTKLPNLIILGLSGSGKSSLARVLAKLYGYQVLDMSAMLERAAEKLQGPAGDIIRHWLADSSERGFAAGGMVDTAGMEAAFNFSLMDISERKPIIIVGTPRIPGRVVSLIKILNQHKRRPNSFRVITLDVEDQKAINQMRNPDRQKRIDQSIETIKTKIATYKSNHAMVIELLTRAHGMIHYRIDANLDQDLVIRAVIGSVQLPPHP